MIASSAFFVLDGILDWPVSLYDGSWSQWGQLSGDSTKAGQLRSDSPWRTDTAARSGVIAYNFGITKVEILSLDGGGCSARVLVDGVTYEYAPTANCTPIPPSAYALSGNQIEEEDAVYMQGAGAGGGGAPITPGY